MANFSPSLTELASKISAAASIIDSYLTKNNIPKPSFNVDGPPGLPNDPEVQTAKMQAHEALMDMKDLLMGPNDLLSAGLVPVMHDHSVLNVLNQFNFWDAVPLRGSASYGDIASKVKLSETMVQRLLRHAMTRHIFAEMAPGSGKIVHTCMSAAPVKNPLLRSWIEHNLGQAAPASLNLADALKRYGESDEPFESASAYTYFRDSKEIKTIFDWFDVDGEGERKGWRARRFGEAMAHITSDPATNIKFIHDCYDWDGLGEAIVVDIGGSTGHVSFELATVHRKLKCIVQDRSNLEASFNAARPAALADRVSFQVHDFFTPEPVRGADVYLFKVVLHNWADSNAIKILRQVVPVMKASSRILIMEFVIPPTGAAPLSIVRLMSALDIQMLTALNSRERTAEDWAALLKEADERLTLQAINQPPGSAFAVIEAVLQS